MSTLVTLAVKWDSFRGGFNNKSIFSDVCIDPNAKCIKPCHSCVCKKGFVGRGLNIRNTAYSQKERELIFTNICFVEKGKPCQSDLLKNMITDPHNILTESGKLNKLILMYEKEFDAYEKSVPDSKKDQVYYDNFGFFTGHLIYWKERQKDTPDMFGKSAEDWSCASGSCSNKICVSGTNPLLTEISFDREEDFTLKSRSSEPTKYITSIYYLFIMFNGCSHLL